MRRDLRNLYALGFVLMLGFKLISSFFSIYLDSIGVTLTNIGIVYAFAAVVAGFVRIPLGTLADSYGRKPFMLLGIMGYPLFAIGIALSQTTVQFISLKVLIEVFGAIFWVAFMAYVYDLLTQEHGGVEMASRNMVFAFAGVVAPIVGGLVIARYGFINLFYLSAIICTLALPVAFFTIKDTTPRSKPSLKKIEQEYEDILRLPEFRMILFTGVAMNFVWAAWMIFMPIYLSDLGIAIPLIGLILSADMLLATFMQLPEGKLIDRFPTYWIVIPGLFLMWISGYFFLLVRRYSSLLVTRLAFGLGIGLSFNPLLVRVGAITPKKEHAGAIALYSAGTAFAAAFASLFGGWFSELYGIRAFLMLASFVALGIAFVVIPWYNHLDARGETKHKKHHAKLHHYGQREY